MGFGELYVSLFCEKKLDFNNLKGKDFLHLLQVKFSNEYGIEILHPSHVKIHIKEHEHRLISCNEIKRGNDPRDATKMYFPCNLPNDNYGLRRIFIFHIMYERIKMTTF